MFNITFGDLLDQTAAKYPDKDALVNVQRGQRFTYQELKEACNRAAKSFLKLGVKKGDKVAIWATNVNEWVIALFGAAKIGAVVVTVNTNYRSHE
ncbi:AMP-binding protein, partial [Dehalococcoidia bacterium]|nr:AMP-binding protein [Dehalococcoidia bacterium]